MDERKANAMSYGMVQHHYPDMIEPLRVSVLRDKATPEQIRTWLDNLESPKMRVSWRMHIEAAARFIQQEAQEAAASNPATQK